MNYIGGMIVMYAALAEAAIQQHTLITENNFDLLTENGNELLIET